jgi:hypothetical protein
VAFPAELREAAEIRDRAREIISTGRYQDRLDPDGKSGPAMRRDDRDPESATEAATTTHESLAPLGEIARVLLYGLMAVALALALIAAVRAFRLRSDGRSAPPARDTRGAPALFPEARVLGTEGSAPSRGDILSEAERLAASGRLGEAAHLLLLAAIEGLGGVPGHWTAAGNRSHTSRELLELLSLEPEQRDAFGELVRVVETFLFGGREVTAEAFDRCRRGFETLAGRPAKEATG